jgi:DNA mismatch endonuclease, patch repair protein
VTVCVHVRKTMQANRSINTRPELVVRRLLFSLGYRYRLHADDLPGRPDIVFPRRRQAIFVHGCFWHQHPDPTCKLRRHPKSNLAYWTTKLRRNQARDQEQLRAIALAGWSALVVWECELTDQVLLLGRLTEFLGQDHPPPTPIQKLIKDR